METNQNTLLELKLELAVLRQQTPKSPKDHRLITDRLVWIGDLIGLIEHIEKK